METCLQIGSLNSWDSHSGESLYLEVDLHLSKGPSLDDNPIVKGFTSTTIQRRHGDLRGQNIRSFILSWSAPSPKVLTTFSIS